MFPVAVSAGFSLLSEPRCRLGGVEDLRGITGGMGGEVGSACEEFDDNEGGTIGLMFRVDRDKRPLDGCRCYNIMRE